MATTRTKSQSRLDIDLTWGPVHEQLFHAVGCSPRDMRFAIKTGTKVDVGSWFGKRTVWLGATGTRLVLWALGPTPVCHAMRFSDVSRSFYNPLTGQLILAPVEGLPESGMTLPYDVAVQVMDYIQERT